MFKIPKLHLTWNQSAFKINKTAEIVASCENAAEITK